MLTVTLEDVVRLNGHLNVQIARRATVHAALAFAVETNTVSRIHTRRNLHREGAGFAHAPFAVTFVARHFDVLATAVTGRAGLLNRKEALLHAYLAVTMTGRAGLFGGARLGAATVTAVTLNMTRDANIHRGARHCAL